MVEMPVKQKTWTLDEVERFTALGAFDRPERYELIDGQLIEKMPVNDPHWFAVRFVTRILQEIFGVRQPMVQQSPLKFGQRDAPEPDLAFLSRDTPRPKPGEVLLIVEVADSSPAYDLGDKARAYARHGVPDYWVVDIPRQRIVVHRAPNPTTEDWGEVRSYEEGEEIALLARPDATVSVAEVLRPGEP